MYCETENVDVDVVMMMMSERDKTWTSCLSHHVIRIYYVRHINT